MDKNRKKIRIIFWISTIVLSGLFGAGLSAFSVAPPIKTILIVVFLSIVCFIAMAINLLWYREFNQKLKALQPILLEEHDANRYIQEIQALLEGKKSPQICGILKLNLSAAYCEKKEYGTAKELLLQIDPRKLGGTNRFVYWADLAYVYFYLQENQKATLILEQQQAHFSKLSNNLHLGGLLAILMIFQKITEGDKPGARQLLDQARPQWKNERTAPDFEYLETLC